MSQILKTTNIGFKVHETSAGFKVPTNEKIKNLFLFLKSGPRIPNYIMYNSSLSSYLFDCIYVSYSCPNGWTEWSEI